MDARQGEYAVGVLFEAVLVGTLCGLFPLNVGSKRGRSNLGLVGLGLSMIAGFLLGLPGALAMAVLMSLVIINAGPPPRRTPSIDTYYF